MTTTRHSNKPFKILHLDFAELRKKKRGSRGTQAFLLAVDECTRMVACKTVKEDSDSFISLFNREMFKDVKVIVADNDPAFRSEHLKEWAEQRNMKLRFAAPCHPQANGMAERAIRDIKQFISLYPDFPGGWKCALEAAVRHHNHSHTAPSGCSPYCAYHRKSGWFPADHHLGLTDLLILHERKKSAEENDKAAMKSSYDREKQL